MPNGNITVMDEEIRDAFKGVRTAFEKVNEKLDGFPCADRGIQLARIEQKLENGEVQKKSRIELWKIWISIAAVILIIIQVLDKLKIW